MIRLGKPYFNSNNQKTGIVMLNYAAKDILNQVKSIAASSSGEIYLLNEQGYWLFHETDPSKEWAFMFDPDSAVSFAAEFPEEWSAMQSGASETIQTKNGLFHYSKLFCGEILDKGVGGGSVFNQTGDWMVVDRIPNTSPDWRYYNNHTGDLLLYIMKRYYVFYVVFAGIAAITSALVVSNRQKNEQVKFYSEYDVMTNSLNRNAGLQRLNALYKGLSRNNCVISICFLDVNGLKEVNDVLGHEAGDELLITVARIIQNNIRSSDFLIRFGGDEFVIVFAGMGKDLAEQVWERITAAFETINQTEQRAYVVSVSHGIEELTCGVNRLLDSILHQADEKMYEEKRKIKGNLQILRS
jgi:diguanylate cyclase (GGDEF)-like protein